MFERIQFDYHKPDASLKSAIASALSLYSYTVHLWRDAQDEQLLCISNHKCDEYKVECAHLAQKSE